MSITDEAYTRGHVQGWADAAATIGARMLQVLAEPEPDPHAAQILCLNCQEPMQLGQPATTVGRDVSNTTLWVHRECPPKTWFGQPQLAVVASKDEDQGDGDQGQEQDDPEVMRTVMVATAMGRPGGPWAIIVSHVDGTWITRLDLYDWTDFLPESAGDRLRDMGLSILPTAMKAKGTYAGWTKTTERRYIAPVVRQSLEEVIPLPPQPPADTATVDSDSGSGYSLPKRVPGQALAAEQQASIVLETKYHSQDDAAHSVTYSVSNTECQACQGPQLLIMTYDETGQWLRSRMLVCQASTCGVVVAL